MLRMALMEKVLEAVSGLYHGPGLRSRVASIRAAHSSSKNNSSNTMNSNTMNSDMMNSNSMNSSNSSSECFEETRGERSADLWRIQPPLRRKEEHRSTQYQDM